MSESSPNTAASRTQPQIVLSGMYPKRWEIGRKKLENGRAPSLEKAQDWRLAATSIERPIRNCTMNKRLIRPSVPFFPTAS